MSGSNLMTGEKIKFVLGLIAGVLVGACAPKLEVNEMVNVQVPQLKLEEHFQAFIETPAGNQEQIVLNHKAQRFDTMSGGFQSNIPYPVNQGFFPVSLDTLLKVPVWIFSQRLSLGDTLAVHLLGIIEYTDGGIEKKELVAIPVESALQTVESKEFEDFIIDNDPPKFVFEYWLKNRHGLGEVSRIKWDGKQKAELYLQSLIPE